MNASAVSVETFATSGIVVGTATPLVMWYGHTKLENADLYNAQVQALCSKMDKRMENDTDQARASGIIVNTNGNIQDVSCPNNKMVPLHICLLLLTHSLLLLLTGRVSNAFENY